MKTKGVATAVPQRKRLPPVFCFMDMRKKKSIGDEYMSEGTFMGNRLDSDFLMQQLKIR